MTRKWWINLLFGAFFVVLHNPNGDEIYVNAEQIDYMGPNPCTEPSKSVVKFTKEDHDKLCVWTNKAATVLMVYGIWVAVAEDRNDIKERVDHVLKQDDDKK
jgi:hypothetical protein